VKPALVSALDAESESACERADSWLARFGSWLLVGFALLLLLPGVRTFPLFDQDEPTFAQIAREMRDTHAWIVPHINGQTAELEKPPLAYWLMSASFAVFGVNELGARAPSILATLGLLLLVQAVGRRWFSARVGFAAAFGLLTCAMVLFAGRAAITDIPLVLSVVASQYACFELLRHEGAKYPWRLFALLYGALAAGTLTKGPVALGALGLTLIAYRLVVWRRPVAWRNLKLAWGLPLVAAGVALWAAPAMVETHGGLWGAGVLQTVQRGLQPFNSRVWFVGYYPIVALFTLMPWMAFAGEGISVLRRHWNATNAYLVSWFAALPLALSFYATQLPHYMLPSFPAFFLILAQILDSKSCRRVWAGVWFWSVMAV
jgi:4-amino-4-deoxy-L-arabinose transferase-like glycosyltransferase